ncbi:MAG: beta-ketoacyl-ACP synthase II [Candidatus Lambdaproteobacteria bacterium]|nr:beta-ketoacyl-ACP synthase II [Candidatus Lambdaproteobacteria bacterium]
MERVVVTGTGVVTCIGNDPQSFWASLLAGRSGIARITAFDPQLYATQIAGEVRDFALDAKQAKRMARFTQFAMVCAQQALEQAGLTPEAGGAGGIVPERIGVAMGTGIGGFPNLEAEHEKFLTRGHTRFHPLTVPMIISNIAAANIAMRFQLQGPNLCISTACATGNHNIAAAFDMIRHGRADAMLAGSTEAVISPFSLNGYIQLHALSTRNDDPQTASRPFSLARDGFVLAEGAGAVLLESLSHARRRGAQILAELAGAGQTADAYHLTAPHPDGRGAIGAMQGALRDAGLNPEQVDYVNAHGTSTPLNDALETEAIRRVFGDHARKLAISSIKSMIGHSLGAAAGIEAVATVLTIQHGAIAPTINLHEPDPALDLDYVPNEARAQRVDVAISNAFAFGGQNAVVAFKRFA